MSAPADFDSRSFIAFDGLSVFENLRYLVLVVRYAPIVRFARSRFRSVTRNTRRAFGRPVLLLCMGWFDWRSADASPAGGSPTETSTVDGIPSPTHRPVVSKTATGITIVDKRRVKLDPDPLNDPVSSSGEESIESNTRPNWWLRVLGAAIRATTSVDVRGLRGDTFVRCLIESRECRSIIANRSDPDVDLGKVVCVAADLSHGDWRAACLHWMKRFADPVAIEILVSRELPNEPDYAKRCFLLRLTPDVSSVLSDANGRALLAVVKKMLERRLDPYGKNGDILLARTVAVTLMRRRPEFDDIVLKPIDEDATGQDQLMMTQLLPVALRGRGLAASLVLADAAVHGNFTKGQFESAARLADVPLRPFLQSDRPIWSGSIVPVGPVVRRLLSWLAVIAMCLSAGSLLQTYLPSIALPPIPIAPAIATLALLATVQVFAANLSNTRLPGAIARYTSQSWSLDMAYGAAVAMILLALMPSGAGMPSLLRNWVSTVALLVWTCGLIMALLAVFRRVDAARAAVGFVSIRRRAARVVGRKWGRYQALAIELDSHIDSCVATEMVPEPVPNVWDRPVASQRHGILMPAEVRCVDFS